MCNRCVEKYIIKFLKYVYKFEPKLISIICVSTTYKATCT